MNRRVLPFVAAGLAAAVLAACATPAAPPPPAPPPAPAPPPPPPPTPAEEFAWSTGRGTASLAVKIEYQPAPGQAWTCTGLVEALMPETSYSRGRMATLYGSADRAVQSTAQVRTRSTANPGPDYSQFVRTVACDAQNSFNFVDLPAGAYFVIARVKPVQANAAGEMVIMQRVEIGNGQAIRITLPQPGGRVSTPPPGPSPAPAAPRRAR